MTVRTIPWPKENLTPGMLMSQNRILSVGCDQSLLGTRASLLEKAGYSVTSANGLQEGLNSLKRGPNELVIICHCIGAADRDQLAKVVKLTQQSTAVLMLQTFSSEKSAWADAATSSAQPEEFLAS